MTQRLDLHGQRFGRLVATAMAERNHRGPRWLCRCDCGKESVVSTRELRTGSTRSCGCLGVERRTAAAVAANQTHGMARTPTYEVWFNMKRRCLDPRHKSYADYGGRGIRVCERWLAFENFLADMGVRPAGLTLERDDVNGDYGPGNCRWATWLQQVRNRRCTVLLSAYGETKAMTVWAEDPRCAVALTALQKRVEAGWAHEDAIARPRRNYPASRRIVERGGAQVWEAVS
jgi:hypothetical protein